MHSQASSCSDAKQMYINGHFCYADKLTILTNGLGIVRHISFIDDTDFKSTHPALIVEKKTGSPDKGKSVGDASALVPALANFFSLHLDFHPNNWTCRCKTPCRHRQSVDGHRCLCNELSTIQSKLEAFSCQKICSCHNTYLSLFKQTQNPMFYGFSETILNNDAFLSLY